MLPFSECNVILVIYLNEGNSDEILIYLNEGNSDEILMKSFVLFGAPRCDKKTNA